MIPNKEFWRWGELSKKKKKKKKTDTPLQKSSNRGLQKLIGEGGGAQLKRLSDETRPE